MATVEDIRLLIEIFAKKTFTCNSSGDFGDEVNKKCLDLLRLDNSFLLIDNSKGRINDQYPPQIPVLKDKQSFSYFDDISLEGVKIDKLINESKFARCRNRFVVPVILYKGKCICRSSTVAIIPEIVLGTTTEKGLSFDELIQLDNKRKNDVELLKILNVGTIIDLMVENRKRKYLMTVTSSEKVDDTQKYSVFRIIPTPYPGCEFFLDFKRNNYNSEGLMFDWSHPSINSTLTVKPNPAVDQLDIQWSKYKTWDLRQLTENYLSLMLKYVWCSSKGILIHCISGWDRTPMFISLLRMSLWADGVIHESLSPSQILYFTLAYDWYLFGHNLANRLEKGEDIMHFCFYFLKYIFSDKFKTPSTPSTATRPSSPIFSSNGNEFDFSDLENVVIHFQNDSSDINSNGSNEDLTKEQPYDTLEDCFSQPDIEKNGEQLNFEFEDSELSSNVDRTLPVDIRTSQQKTRTFSNSSDPDEWSMVTQSGSLNENELSENRFRPVSSRENKLSAVRELFYKCYSAHGYKTDCPEGILSKLLF